MRENASFLKTEQNAIYALIIIEKSQQVCLFFKEIIGSYIGRVL